MKKSTTLLFAALGISLAACGGVEEGEEFSEVFATTEDAICANPPCVEPVDPPPVSPPTRRPNLTARVSRHPGCFDPPGWVTIVVRNAGAATARASKLRVQNYPFGDIDVPQLTAGSEVAFDLWWVPPTPPYVRTAISDATNLVTESNENDNGTAWACASL